MYKYMPAYLQDLAVSFRGLTISRYRYGREFQEAYAAYLERGSWPEKKILEFREKQRAAALQRAAKAPFYSALFEKMGGVWQDFLDESAFRELPVITKADIQADIDPFRPRAPLPTDGQIMTSGTTGTSLTLPVSQNVEPDQWAVWWRYRGWHGIRRGQRCGLFASAPVVLGTDADRPYRINWANNEVRFSIFHISRRSAPKYVESINRHRPSWVHGNPTAIAVLSRYMIEDRLSLDYKIKVLTVGSENILPWQRDAIVAAFGVPPRQHYGLAEAVANFSECEHGRLHVDEDFSYVEFLADTGLDSRRIVGSAFSNTAVSLLRYDAGDLGRVAMERCSCGRWGRIVERLDGRLTDYVVLPNGARVASLAAPFHGTEGLFAAQLYQGKDGALTVRYVPGKGWRNEALAGLEARLRIRLGEEIQISFLEVADLSRTSRGKTKLVVSDYDPVC